LLTIVVTLAAQEKPEETYNEAAVSSISMDKENRGMRGDASPA